MKYLAQVRTKTFADKWTHWTNIGDPMTLSEAEEWLSLQSKCATGGRVEFKILVVTDTWPVVFKG